jgi:hypothetical protein
LGLQNFRVLEIEMHKPSDDDFQRKARFDLWLHQNTMFWSRFQLLYILQASFFVIYSTIRRDRLVVCVVLGVTLLFMVMLFSILDTDRRLRNYNARKLKDDYEYDPLPQKVTAPRLIPPQLIELGFQILMFAPFIFADIYVVFGGADLPLGEPLLSACSR